MAGGRLRIILYETRNVSRHERDYTKALLGIIHARAPEYTLKQKCVCVMCARTREREKEREGVEIKCQPDMSRAF